MSDTSDRLHLPLIAAGQAQKEASHNEALALADMLIQPVVIAVAPGTVPVAPVLGQCWIVGPGASGAWTGRDAALACWTSGGWRFADAFEGLTAWNLATSTLARRTATGWSVGVTNASAYHIGGVQVLTTRQAAISAPSGGGTIDAEARLAVAAILATLRTHGMIAP